MRLEHLLTFLPLHKNQQQAQKGMIGPWHSWPPCQQNSNGLPGRPWNRCFLNIQMPSSSSSKTFLVNSSKEKRHSYVPLRIPSSRQAYMIQWPWMCAQIHKRHGQICVSWPRSVRHIRSSSVMDRRQEMEFVNEQRIRKIQKGPFDFHPCWLLEEWQVPLNVSNQRHLMGKILTIIKTYDF